MNCEKKNIHKEKTNEEVDNLSFDVDEEVSSTKLEHALEELEYMEKHPEEYMSFKSIEELMNDLISEDN